MAPSANKNTGKKDAKGRIIWMGPKGGVFVRGSNGKKLAVSTGGYTHFSANTKNFIARKMKN